MTTLNYTPSIKRDRSNWIRLRTMIWIRWFAIFGQVAALIVASKIYHLDLPLGMCFLVVGVSVVGNLVAMFVYPENRRLSEGETLAMVLFDLLQLGALLYLTGGLHNPFSMLVLAPVTISATVLSSRVTILVALIAIIIITGLVNFHVPLRTEMRFIMRVPDIFLFGNWVGVITAIIFISLYLRRVSSEIHSMADAVTATQMALAREQKLTDLGGVVAAAAHELGTPLATIKLTSSELIEELEDRPELREDAALIRDQADRCRDILRSMGRAGKDDLHMRSAPLSAVLTEASEPHQDRGKALYFEDLADLSLDEPHILRRPEIIHGLRNLVQNAVDFAKTSVWIESNWCNDTITLRIMDDGDGFPHNMIGRIGDPFMRRRKSNQELRQRPEYEGMGLGLFIAKTLLERTGAELRFANGSDPFLPEHERPERCGAIIQVSWKRSLIDAHDPENQVTPAKNIAFKV